MTQQLSDDAERVPTAHDPRIHRLAVLAVVVGVLVPPVGAVLAARVLRRTHRESQEARLAIAALLVALVVLVGEVVILVAAMTGATMTGATMTGATMTGATMTGATATGATAPAPGTAQPTSVRAACGVVMPALGEVRTDVAKATSADQYGELLTRLANRIVAGAGAATDATFLDHVGQLSQAFQKAWQDSSNGTAPSTVADELTAGGVPVGRDCAAAGYHP